MGRAVFELALAFALIGAGIVGALPISSTPWLFALAWISLAARRRGWRDVGLRAPSSWPRVLGLGALTGVALQAFSLYLLEPWIAEFTGRLPDVSVFAALEGDAEMLLQLLVLAWVLAAFGEETIFRGWLFERCGTLAGGGRVGAWAAVAATSVVFGLAHLYQGAAGVITTGIMGAVFATIYLRQGRNLWLPIVAHGVFDTVAFVMIYLGVYPGMHGGDARG